MIKNKKNRRKFIGEMLGICAAAPVLLQGMTQEGSVDERFSSIRKRLSNPYLENGKPVVVVVKGTEYSKMLAKGMALLGGFSRFGTGKSVIVKPNFVFNKKTRYPTTTDENSVLTTVQYLQKEGFHDITVADRRGNRDNGRAGGKFEWSGLNDMAQDGGFKTDSLMDNSVAESIQVKDNRWEIMPSIGVIKKIYDADLIINMPTLKKHTQTNLTCSLKNMMGVLDVPTTEHMHLWDKKSKNIKNSMTRDEVAKRLSLAIAEAAMAVGPEMTVIDARQVLCKNHLNVQSGLPLEANRLILSGDSLAADMVAARILKEVYEPYDLGFTRDTFEYAGRLGLGVGNPDKIIIKEVEV